MHDIGEEMEEIRNNGNTRKKITVSHYTNAFDEKKQIYSQIFSPIEGKMGNNVPNLKMNRNSYLRNWQKLYLISRQIKIQRIEVSFKFEKGNKSGKRRQW